MRKHEQHKLKLTWTLNGSKVQLQPSFPEKCCARASAASGRAALSFGLKKWTEKVSKYLALVFQGNMFSFPILKQTWDHGDWCFISLKKENCQKFNESLLLGRESAVWLGVSTFLKRMHIFHFGMTPVLSFSSCSRKSVVHKAPLLPSLPSVPRAIPMGRANFTPRKDKK